MACLLSSPSFSLENFCKYMNILISRFKTGYWWICQASAIGVNSYLNTEKASASEYVQLLPPFGSFYNHQVRSNASNPVQRNVAL